MPSLIVTSMPDKANWFRLTKRTLTAGRDPANAIQITDDKASRKHFQVRFQDGLYLLTDLKSHNGTYLNGSQVQEALLKDGDTIQAGKTTLVYTDQEITDQTDALQYFKKVSRHLRDDPTITDQGERGSTVI